jgi:hypothetical protein
MVVFEESHRSPTRLVSGSVLHRRVNVTARSFTWLAWGPLNSELLFGTMGSLLLQLQAAAEYGLGS